MNPARASRPREPTGQGRTPGGLGKEKAGREGRLRTVHPHWHWRGCWRCGEWWRSTVFAV